MVQLTVDGKINFSTVRRLDHNAHRAQGLSPCHDLKLIPQFSC